MAASPSRLVRPFCQLSSHVSATSIRAARCSSTSTMPAAARAVSTATIHANSARVTVPRHSLAFLARRAFGSCRVLQATTAADVMAPAPVKRPVGAFRGGLLGFLLGSTLAAYATYAYILDEYRVANELLTEDIYALQAAVQRIHNYVTELEVKVDQISRKK